MLSQRQQTACRYDQKQTADDGADNRRACVSAKNVHAGQKQKERDPEGADTENADQQTGRMRSEHAKEVVDLPGADGIEQGWVIGTVREETYQSEDDQITRRNHASHLNRTTSSQNHISRDRSAHVLGREHAPFRGRFGTTRGAAAAHSHPHEQAGVILAGSLTLTIDGDVKVLGLGDIYIAEGGVEHSGVAIGSEGCRALDIFSPVREDYQFE